MFLLEKKFWVCLLTVFGLLFGAIALKFYKIDAIAEQVTTDRLENRASMAKYRGELEDVRVESRVNYQMLREIIENTKETNAEVIRIRHMLDKQR